MSQDDAPRQRGIVWFSAGAASAVTAKLAIAEYQTKGIGELVIAYIDPGSEHLDNKRFILDCEQWFGQEVVRLKSDRYTDTWDVWEKRRFLVGPQGALCTTELKKMVRYGFQRPTDVQAFGYTANETHRANRFRAENPGVDLWCPLIERSMTKVDCLAIIARSGIEIPAMYRLGYANNNCIGCPKGGMGYWNKIRVDFPAVFERMGRLERELKHSILKDKNGPVWLDELDPARGNFPTESPPECSLICASAEDTINENKTSEVRKMSTQAAETYGEEKVYRACFICGEKFTGGALVELNACAWCHSRSVMYNRFMKLIESLDFALTHHNKAECGCASCKTLRAIRRAQDA